MENDDLEMNRYVPSGVYLLCEGKIYTPYQEVTQEILDGSERLDPDDPRIVAINIEE